jgi:hypothetical protein
MPTGSSQDQTRDRLTVIHLAVGSKPKTLSRTRPATHGVG